MIELVVCDLDGTLLRPDLTVAPRVREALEATRARGVPILVASGRMYRSVEPWACELGLDGPLICYQGAYIREPRGGPLLRHRPLPASVARGRVVDPGAWPGPPRQHR